MLGPGEDERIPAAFGGTYRRLAEIKAKWDPDNLFCRTANIVPGS